MTKIQYSITDTDEFSGAVIFIDGEPVTVSSDNHQWEELRDLLIQGTEDIDRVRALSSPAAEVSRRFLALSERITLRDEQIYLDGDVLENVFTEHLLRILADGAEGRDAGFPAYVAFLEKLATNPSKKSRKHLTTFVEANKLVLAPDGDIIAYKGVGPTGLSSNAGYGIVNGEIFENAQLQNDVGSVIEIPRSMVDDDRDSTCSTGLHVGAYNYASRFAQKLLTVKVNPRDVVAVPFDASNQKMRVCRYVVVETTVEEITRPTHAFVVQVVEAEDEDYSEDENETEEPEFYEDEDEDSEAAPSPREYTIQVVNPAQVVPVQTPEEKDFLDRVARMQIVLETLPEGTNLRRYRNKNVTSKNRLAFDKAIELA